ncbi:MAG: hypothetical protein LWX54_03165 [Deltaproteobacteria bacterium]|jgi:hypothetical protein|nr:hypothetical protein [Deltaproteobacteria bacterium]
MSILITICIFISILFIIFFIIGILEKHVIKFQDKKIRNYNYTIGKKLNGTDTDIIDNTYTPTFETCAKFLGASKVPAIANYSKFNKHCVLYKLNDEPNISTLFNNKWINNKIFRTSDASTDINVNDINECKKIHSLYNSDFTTYNNKNKLCSLNTFPDSQFENYVIIPDDLSINTPYDFTKAKSNKGYIINPDSTLKTLKTKYKYNDLSKPEINSIDDCAEYLLEKQNYELLFDKTYKNVPFLAQYDANNCDLYKYWGDANPIYTDNTNTYKLNNKITNVQLRDNDIVTTVDGKQQIDPLCTLVQGLKNVNQCMTVPTGDKTYVVWTGVSKGNKCYICNFPKSNGSLIFNNSSTHL